MGGGSPSTEVACCNQVGNQVRVYEVCLVLLTKVACGNQVGNQVGCRSSMAGSCHTLTLLTEVACGNQVENQVRGMWGGGCSESSH